VVRLSIKEAADRLHVSEITVRRRIKNGDLAGEHEETPQGYRWVVLLPDGIEDDTVVNHTNSSRPAQSSTPAVDRELVNEVRDQLDYLKRIHEEDRRATQNETVRFQELLAQQVMAIQQLTQRVDALPAQVAPAPAEVASTAREEEVRHYYLSQAVSPMIMIAYGFIPTVVLVLWSFVDDPLVGEVGRRALDVALLFSVLALGYMAAFGLRRIQGVRMRLIEEDVLTVEQARSQRLFQTIATFPIPERLTMWGMVLLLPVFVLFLVGQLIYRLVS